MFKQTVRLLLLHKAPGSQQELQKQEIANYFLAELSLFAEMCLDRNYIAMESLHELFSYEALVTILKLQVFLLTSKSQ